MQTVEPVKPSRAVATVLSVTAALLLVPLVAMQFSSEVAWTLADFIVAGVLIAGTGLLYVVLAGRAGGTRRLLIGAALGAAFVLVWLELAVGLFGTPFAGS
jgi:hypothetical protein